MTTVARLITAEELLTMPNVGRCELIRGELIHMSPAGFSHGSIASGLLRQIGNFVAKNQLGITLAAETGFYLERNPDTVRASDVAFVARQRIPADTFVRGFFEGAPDLAVEVISPGDVQDEVRAKVEQWLAAGAVSVWVVDPRNRSIDVFRKASHILTYRAGDKLTDEPTLPGFTMKVSELFNTL